MQEKWYVIRTTTDKLNDTLARITEAGDFVVPPLYPMGGRDWVVLAHMVELDPEPLQLEEPVYE